MARKKAENQDILKQASSARKYELFGEMVTVTEIAEKACRSRVTVSAWLREGKTPEQILDMCRERGPVCMNSVHDFYPLMLDQSPTLDVVFDHHVPGVYKSMQPELGKIYRAIAVLDKSPQFYVISLDGEKPLIVYRREFRVATDAEKAAAGVSD